MNKTSSATFQTDYAVAPGKTIAECIEAAGMTKSEFAQRLDISEPSLFRLLDGQQPISAEVARRLELVTGAPASFWNNLEFNYRSDLRRLSILREEERNREWLREQPIRELVRRGLVVGGTDEERFLSALSFYATASVDAWNAIWKADLDAAARISPKYTCERGPLAAWMRSCQLVASRTPAGEYDRDAFRKALADCRPSYGVAMSEETLLRIRGRLAECGVALVFVRAMPKAPLEGVTCWRDGRPMMALSLRGGRADKFWFSLYHEAHHLLERPSRRLALFFGQDRGDADQERRADAFAAESLVPSRHNDDIRCATSLAHLDRIARENDLCLDAVIGRRQHLTGDFRRHSGEIGVFRWRADEWRIG